MGLEWVCRRAFLSLEGRQKADPTGLECHGKGFILYATGRGEPQ